MLIVPNLFGTKLRAITLFKLDLTHNNVVSGLQGDSSFLLSYCE